MKLRIAVLLLILSAFVHADILKYSAFSKNSQKEADQLAMDGLAKQLRSKVSSEFSVTSVENGSGKVDETVVSKKSVSTNIIIKGAKITQGPNANGRFQSTVTIDTDQMASKILVDLSSLKDKMKALDPVIRKSILNGDYRKMTVDMVNFEKLVDEYELNLENLSCLQKITPELKLETAMGDLHEFVTANMSNLKLRTELSESELKIFVEDVAGPVEYFPIALIQDNKDLAHDKTNRAGVVVFPIETLKKKKPSGEVIVHADLNFKYVRLSDFIAKTVRYSTAKNGCSYSLSCDGPVEACGALRSLLNDAGFTILDNDDLQELKATLTFEDKPNSAKTLFTSKATTVLRLRETNLTEGTQGVGRNVDAAQVKAIQKLPVPRINELFGKFCW